MKLQELVLKLLESEPLDFLFGRPTYVGKINARIYRNLFKDIPREVPETVDVTGHWKSYPVANRNGGYNDLHELDDIDEVNEFFFVNDHRRYAYDNAEIINVSGTQFLVDFSVFEPYPDTLLGSSRMNQFYIPAREEYFLERQKHVFTAVMRFYTNDEELVCPPCIPKHVFESELEFYGLSSYYHKVNTAPVAHLKDYKAKSRREEILLHIEFPGYSALATAYAIFDLMIIIISTIILVLESVDELKRYHLFEKTCYAIEVAVNIYFTIQTVILITVYPSRRLYFSSVTNWIDIISILPFYLKLAAKEYLNQVGGFRVLRLIRLLRILKLFRHSPGSQTMIHFLLTSIPEIVLLLLMWSIGVLMFGPLIYFVEQGHEPSNTSTTTSTSSKFSSAFSGMWFCVVTIGTVGYGDMVPQTEPGKVLAAMYTIVNLTIMTIPISIIITKFNKSMKRMSS